MKNKIILSPTIKNIFSGMQWRLTALEAYRQNNEAVNNDNKLWQARIAELAERVAVLEHRLSKR